jgi:hypothetical protein
MTRPRMMLVAGILALAAGGGGAVAFACTVEPVVDEASSPVDGSQLRSGPSNTVVSISGTGYAWAPEQVQVRWAGPSGQVLATTQARLVSDEEPVRRKDGSTMTSGTYFSVNVAIPAAPPGLYDLVVMGKDYAYGRQTNKLVPGGFEITAATTTAPPATPTASPTARPVARPGPQAAPGRVAPALASAAAPGPADLGAVPGPVDVSVAPGPVDLAPAPGQAPAPSRGSAVQVSARSVTAELSSAFASPSGRARSPRPAQPSLLSSAPATSSTPVLALGTGLLAAGLSVLVLASAVAGVTRRRVRVKSSAGRLD